MQGASRVPMIDVRERMFWKDSRLRSAAITMIRGYEVPGMALWHDSISSRRNSQFHSWRWNTEND
eukprot:6775018-Pyramimonas_sp.AAC.1